MRAFESWNHLSNVIWSSRAITVKQFLRKKELKVVLIWACFCRQLGTWSTLSTTCIRFTFLPDSIHFVSSVLNRKSDNGTIESSSSWTEAPLTSGSAKAGDDQMRGWKRPRPNKRMTPRQIKTNLNLNARVNKVVLSDLSALRRLTNVDISNLLMGN